jgi:hypothetical protein
MEHAPTEHPAQHLLQRNPETPAARSESSTLQRQEGQTFGDSFRQVAQSRTQDRLQHNARQTAQRQRLDSLQRVSSESGESKSTSAGGLPNGLRVNMEAMSGLALDDVRVHRNSDKPAQLNALAYAQGRHIYLGPGQEKHLPHEAWHVVQQAQGRVQPTMQMKGGVPINGDKSLEREADVMGAKAAQMKSSGERSAFINIPHESRGFSADNAPIQAAGLFSTIWGTAKAVTGSLPGLLVSGAALAAGIATANPLLTYGGGAALAHGLYSTFHGRAEEDSPYVPPTQQPHVSSTPKPYAPQTLNPSDFEFTTHAADTVTKPLSTTDFPKLTGRTKDSGVEIGDIASYKVVQWLEKVGDDLTGDHQPSGAAIKEALRIQLHKAKTNVLTRTQLTNAYARAVTIVMTDAWHKKFSRTYGGRNTKKQIQDDAVDLSQAAAKDWDKTYPELFSIGFSDSEVSKIENNFISARKRFFKTGEAQSELLK